jgi:hypothetical protein
MGRRVDAATVRASLAEFFASEKLLDWERWVDDAIAEREKTRVYEGARSQQPPPQQTSPQAQPAHAQPMSVGPRAAILAGSRRAPSGPSPRLLAIAASCSIGGALFVAIVARGCRGDRVGGLERRVAHIEDILGIEDAGTAAATGSSTPAAVGDGAAGAEERSATGPSRSPR